KVEMTIVSSLFKKISFEPSSLGLVYVL
ncbi:uncharacterized protein METZ01_LOCUS425573, partial [marine metagenome]